MSVYLCSYMQECMHSSPREVLAEHHFFALLAELMGVLWLRSACMKDGLNRNDVWGSLIFAHMPRKWLPNGATQTHLHPPRSRQVVWIHMLRIWGDKCWKLSSDERTFTSLWSKNSIERAWKIVHLTHPDVHFLWPQINKNIILDHTNEPNKIPSSLGFVNPKPIQRK